MRTPRACGASGNASWIIALALGLAGCGGGGGDPVTARIATLEIFAGTWGPAASVDGTGSQANFFSIADMAFDGEGNLLVVDSAIRKVTPAAVVSTLASPPRIFRVIAVDRSGQAFVGEWQFGVCRLGTCSFGGSIHRMDSTGATTMLTGVHSVGGLVATNGDLYWTDFQMHAIRRLSAAGDLTTVAGIEGSRGSEDGPGQTARFNFPEGLAMDRAGNLYVADSLNHTIRKIAPDGAVTTIAGSPGAIGSNDGAGSAARLNLPAGLAVDDTGNLYVADAGNCTVRKVSPAGIVTTVAGSAGACGVFIGGALPGALHAPRHVALKGNDLYIGMRHGIAVVRPRP